jgi:thioredoxin 1
MGSILSKRRVVRVVALGAFLAAVYLLAQPPLPQKPETPQASVPAAGAAAKTPGETAKLPRMVDVGKTYCIPCKMMVPVLQEAQLRYKGKAVIEFVDLEEHPEAAQQYKVMMIPTQVFYNSDGKEVDRHVGFLPFEEVEKIFAKMGVERSS